MLGTGLLGGLDSLGLVLLPSSAGSLLLFSLWVGGGGVAKIAIINTYYVFSRLITWNEFHSVISMHNAYICILC